MTAKHERIFIALGANLGDRRATLEAALRDLADTGDVRVVRCSTFIETEAVGGPPDQPRYLNAVAELETSLAPHDLHRLLMEIEIRHGRRRDVPNGPRTLDLDLLLFGDRVIDKPDLIVPHPRMWQRDFVLMPLAEICDAEHLDRLRACFEHNSLNKR